MSRTRVKLSVVVPAHDAASFISRTLSTLAQQTRPVHQVVVVDDGSRDATMSVVDAIRQSTDLPLTVVSQRNLGVSAARNVGFAAVTGDFVLFLDADDLVEPTLVEALESTLDDTPAQVDIVTWRFQHMNEDGSLQDTFDTFWAPTIPPLATGPQVLRRVLIERFQVIWTGSAAYRADFLRQESLGFSVGCATGEDSEFIWKALGVAGLVAWINSTLSTYVDRAGSVTSTPDVRRLDGAAAYQRAADFLSDLTNRVSADVAREIQDRVPPRYMLGLSILARARKLSRHTFLEIEERNPGLTTHVRRVIRRNLLAGGRPTASQLLLTVSPALCAWYLKVTQPGYWRSASLPSLIRRPGSRALLSVPHPIRGRERRSPSGP